MPYCVLTIIYCKNYRGNGLPVESVVRKQNRPRIYPNGLQPGGLFSEQCDP